MARLQISISGLLVAVAGVSIALALASQPLQRALGGLLTLLLLWVPAVVIALRYGKGQWLSMAGMALKFLLAILTALLGVGAVALGLGTSGAVAVILAKAVVDPFDPVVALAIGLTLFALGLAGSLIVLKRGPARAFGVGFLVAGGPYLVLGLAPVVWADMPVLLSTDILHGLYPQLYLTRFPDPEPPDPTIGGRSASRIGMPPGSPPSVGPGYLRFQRVGHCVATLAIAAAFGRLARSLATGRAPAGLGREEARAEPRPLLLPDSV